LEYEVDVVILGPVATLGLLGGGTPTEVRDFERLVQDMRAAVGRPVAVVLAHHDNKAGQVSGAWGPVPDLLVQVSGQGHGRRRLHWQKARWASRRSRTHGRGECS
jgi:hypothetical protein